MVRIRLSRTGKKKQASYRVVVADSKSPRDGRIVERIGFYNPMPDPAEYRINEERALYWLSVGAQPSDAVRRLLEKQGTYDRLTRLQAGESFENLVAEFTGVVAGAAPAVTETAETAVEEAAEADVVETVSETAADVVEAVAETVAEVVETVSETAETVSEAAMAAVDELVGRDEEE
jgi:small subunit ribosomal protein S16